MSSAKPEKGVTIILQQGEKVLLILRDSNPDIPHPEQYALPSGSLHGHALFDSAFHVLNRVFGWAEGEVEVRYIGKSAQVAGFFFGKIPENITPVLRPGEGKEIQWFTADDLGAFVATVGAGNERGQVVPLILKRLALIQALLTGQLRAHTGLIRG